MFLQDHWGRENTYTVLETFIAIPEMNAIYSNEVPMFGKTSMMEDLKGGIL